MPTSITEIVLSLLQPSINFGLDEEKFWCMSVAEVERYLKGVEWRMKLQAQFDYSLADLIGISVARTISSEAKFPSIEEVYPTLFKKDEQKQEASKQEIAAQNSVNRFLEFAAKHNAKMKKEDGKNYASGTT